jgi:hypothetical protein
VYLFEKIELKIMLKLPKSCFLHIPKTGGTWVKAALEAARVPIRAINIGDNSHPGINYCPQDCHFRFSFVRHPLALYRSYWQYKMTIGWDDANLLDSLCSSTNFYHFVDKVVAHFPGIYSKNLQNYIGTPEHPIEFIGRYENLVEDLITALTLAGEEFSAPAIRNLPPINVSDKAMFSAEFSPGLLSRVSEAESELITRCGYAAKDYDY